MNAHEPPRESTVFTIAPAALRAMADHAARAAPQECCGLLLGTGRVIVEARAARNELQSGTRYRIDPRDHFAAIRAGRATGRAIIGAYHSHPSGAAVPSATDLAEAWPEFLYVIVALAPRVDDAPLRGWWLVDGNFVEVPLVPRPEESHLPCLHVPPSEPSPSPS
jgi:proteasome lid subunit RPN8/RPN11